MLNKLEDKLSKIKGSKGFTLIELIVVIGIIGILVGIASPRFNGFSAKARFAAVQQDIKVLEDASSLYHLENNDWPYIVNSDGTRQIVTGEKADALKVKIGLSPEEHLYSISEPKLAQNTKAKETLKSESDNGGPGYIGYLKYKYEDYVMVTDGKLAGHVFQLENAIGSDSIFGKDEEPEDDGETSPEAPNPEPEVPSPEPEPEPEPENEIIRLGDVPQGKIVYDETWTWNFRNAGTGTGMRNIDWIVAGHDIYGYAKNSTTLFSSEVLEESSYSTSNTQSSLRANNANAMNSSLDRIKKSFGSNFRNGMYMTSFTEQTFGQRNYTFRKDLFIPSQHNLGGGSTNAFMTGGANWRLSGGLRGKIGSRTIGYWTRSAEQSYQGGAPIVGMRYYYSLMGRFASTFASNSTGIGTRPATNFNSDTMVQKQEDGRYLIIW